MNKKTLQNQLSELRKARLAEPIESGLWLAIPSFPTHIGNGNRESSDYSSVPGAGLQESGLVSSLETEA
jgi:hypothetical protein